MDDRETNRQVLIDRLRRAQAVAQVGSWELDLGTRTMWGSEEAFRLYGLAMTPGQVMLLPVVQTIPLPEYRPVLDRALEDLVAGRGRYDVEFEICRADDGARRHIHSLAELCRRPGEVRAVVVGTVQDITARKAIEAALRASEERFRLILEHAADAIVIGGRNGIVELNERACTLTGYSREEVLRLRMDHFFPPSELARAPLRYDLLDRSEAVITERVLRRKDGTLVPVEMHSTRMPDGTYQTIFRDMTERRRLEAHLQLRQRMDSIGALASGIAHDFNNILVAVQGYAELLRDETAGLAPNARDAAEHVRVAAERAAGLVRRLRSLSKPEQRGTETFDLQPIVADVFQMLSETTDRRIRKECSIAQDTWFVSGVDSDVYHAVVNVALNGIQAIEDKGVGEHDAVRLDASMYEAVVNDTLGLPAGRYVHVALSDTGIGMSDEVQARAFDPLFSTKARGVRKGQGLGLTMVYNIIVSQHGGAITIDSTEGRGTTFHLYLPAGLRPLTAVHVTPVVPATQQTGGVLIVEDEEAVAGLMRQVLIRSGYRVLVAGDGAVGIDMFTAHGADIDLVILDQTLPRLSGLEVLRELSRQRPGVRVIMSSGDQVPIPAGLSAAIEFLPKPFSLGDLKAAVRKALGGEEEPRT
jgi:PAS domain S-box-containing protein